MLFLEINGINEKKKGFINNVINFEFLVFIKRKIFVLFNFNLIFNGFLNINLRV